jgi:hypothetical protein
MSEVPGNTEHEAAKAEIRKANGPKPWQPVYLGRAEEQCPEFTRGSHLALCPTCGTEIGKHQQYSWGAPDFLLYLYKLCDGSFIKP